MSIGSPLSLVYLLLHRRYTLHTYSAYVDAVTGSGIIVLWVRQLEVCHNLYVHPVKSLIAHLSLLVFSGTKIVAIRTTRNSSSSIPRRASSASSTRASPPPPSRRTSDSCACARGSNNNTNNSNRHGCQMAIAGLLDRMCLALWASGLWLHYAALQNLIPSFPWIAPPRPPP